MPLLIGIAILVAVAAASSLTTIRYLPAPIQPPAVTQLEVDKFNTEQAFKSLDDYCNQWPPAQQPKQ